MAKIKFIQRTTKKNTELEPLYVRVVIGRSFDKRAKTGLFVNPEDWNAKQEELRDKATTTNRDEKNRKIEDLRRFIQDAINDLPDKQEISKDWLNITIDKFWSPEKYENKPINLFSYIEDFIKQSEQSINPKTGSPVHYRIRRDYIRAFGLLKEFSTTKGREYDFNDIDLDFYNDWIDFLQTYNIGSTDEPKFFAANTIGKFTKNLKVFLNKATEDGINQNMKYKSHRFVKIQVETDSIYLDETDLNKLWSLNLTSKPHQERVRDLFLVGCWSGLRFGDLSRVKPENIKDGFINVKQSKTGDKVVIPLHPVVSAILEKYNGQLPTAISNQKTNLILKEIATAAKLNDEVHLTETRGGIKRTIKRTKKDLICTHTARRSFATNLYKSNFPPQSIMKITGHKSESAFLQYLKVSPDEHARLLQDHWLKQSSHLKIV